MTSKDKLDTKQQNMNVIVWDAKSKPIYHWKNFKAGVYYASQVESAYFEALRETYRFEKLHPKKTLEEPSWFNNTRIWSKGKFPIADYQKIWLNPSHFMHFWKLYWNKN